MCGLKLGQELLKPLHPDRNTELRLRCLLQRLARGSIRHALRCAVLRPPLTVPMRKSVA